MSFLKNAINNDKGFFQNGKSFGGKGIDGLFSGFGAGNSEPIVDDGSGADYYQNVVLPQLRAQNITEAQQTGINPNTGRNIQFAPTTGKFGALNQALMRGGIQ